MFLTPDRFDRRRDPQPDEDDEQHREHRDCGRCWWSVRRRAPSRRRSSRGPPGG